MTGIRWRLRMAFPAVGLVVVVFGVLFAPAVLASEGHVSPGLIPTIPPSVTATVVPLQPHLSAAPLAIDFGAAVVGSKEVAAMTVVNDGAVPAGVTTVSTKVTPATQFAMLPSNSSCAAANLNPPGGTCEIDYVFTPTSVGDFNAAGVLDITYTDQHVVKTFNIKLTGCGVVTFGTCPPKPTPTPTPSRGATTRPAPGGVAAAPATTTITDSDAAQSPGSTVGTGPLAVAAEPHSSEGPNGALLVLATVGAAIMGAMIAGVLILRGRWLLSKVRARGGQGPSSD